MTVGIGGWPSNYRSDASESPTDERVIDSVLIALGELRGVASAAALASFLGVNSVELEATLRRMRDLGLVHYEVARPGEVDGIAWRRSSLGIERAEKLQKRLAARR